MMWFLYVLGVVGALQLPVPHDSAWACEVQADAYEEAMADALSYPGPVDPEQANLGVALDFAEGRLRFACLPGRASPAGYRMTLDYETVKKARDCGVSLHRLNRWSLYLFEAWMDGEVSTRDFLRNFPLPPDEGEWPLDSTRCLVDEFRPRI